MTMGIYDKYKKLVLPANIIKTQITKSLPGGAPGTIVSGGLGNEGVDLVVWTQERIDDNSIKIAGLTELIQLTGVPQYSTNLGTFSGTIIPDNTTIKNALQVLEVALMNATGGGSTGGIYGGSGFISTQAVATVTDTFSIKADSVGKLIQLGDVNNDFPGSNFSLGGTGIKIMPGNSVTIGGPFSNTFQPYIQVTKIETNIKQTEDDYIRLHRTAVSELRTSKQYFNISTPFAGSFKGLMYELDYSANFGPRSLVDKGYVDSKFQSIPDGDKGDITVSNTGSVWTINNGIVTFSKMQNVTTQTLLGRYDAGSGTIQEIVLGSGLSLIGNTLVASGGGGGTGFVPTTRTLTINGTTYDLSANRTWNINSMVYPPAGIPVSTGSAWGTSITDNSKDWDDAFSWGNHASAGYAYAASLGTMASQNANNVNITGGSITGITDLAVADGGTGASTASGALVNLLPSYTGNATKVLAVNSTTNGVEWVTVPLGTGWVPYTGATSNIDLGTYGYTGDFLTLNTAPDNIPTTAGTLSWNASYQTADLKLNSNVTLQLGQEQLIRVVNKSSADLTQAAYKAVRLTGAQGQRPTVNLAQANNELNSTETIGLVTENINDNQEGFVTTFGLVNDINTTGTLQSETWLDGDTLYLSPSVAGGITKVKPSAPNHLVIIGYVVYAHAIHGKIFVKVNNGYELDELHNVAISNPQSNEILKYDGTKWINGTAPATVAGNNTEVQYNNSGSLGASSNFTWDNTSKTLGLTNINNIISPTLLFKSKDAFNIPQKDSSYDFNLVTTSTSPAEYTSLLNINAYSNNGVYKNTPLSILNIYDVSTDVLKSSSVVVDQKLQINSIPTTTTTANGILGITNEGTLFKTSLGSSLTLSNTGTFDVSTVSFDKITAGQAQLSSSQNIAINYSNSNSGLLVSNSGYSVLGSPDGLKTLTVDNTGVYTTSSTAIGTNSINANAILSLNSTTKGLLLPTVNTTDRDAMTLPSDGIMIYNPSVGKFQGKAGNTWVDFGGGGSAAGNTGEIQFNNAGAFGASSNLFWNSTDSRLGIRTSVPEAPLTIENSGIGRNYAINNGLTLINRTPTLNATNHFEAAPEITFLGNTWIDNPGLNGVARVSIRHYSTGYTNAGRNELQFVFRSGTAAETVPFMTGTNGTTIASLITSSINAATGGTQLTILPGAGATNGIGFINGTSDTSTSLERNSVTISQGFSPTSGTAIRNLLNLTGTFNQTGTATGISRGLFVNPTLTAAANWRSIEWSNNTGWGLYGAGTANNYLNGNLSIKSSTASITTSNVLTTSTTTTGWTGTSFSTGYTHTAGNTNTLIASAGAPTVLPILSGQKYTLTYTLSGVTAGTVTISIGGLTTGAVGVSGTLTGITTNTNSLTITPTSDFNGTIIATLVQVFDTSYYSTEAATTGSGTNWTGTSYATGYTHTVGATTALNPSNLSLVLGAAYELTYTSSGITAGSATLVFGDLSTTISTNTTLPPNRFICTNTANPLRLTPTSNFDGTVIISIKRLAYSTASIQGTSLQVFGSGSDNIASFIKNDGSTGVTISNTGALSAPSVSAGSVSAGSVTASGSVSAGFSSGLFLDSGVLSIVRNNTVPIVGTVGVQVSIANYSGGLVFSSTNIYNNNAGGMVSLLTTSATIAHTGTNTANYRFFNNNYGINNTGTSSSTITGIYSNATVTALNGATHNLISLNVNSNPRFTVTDAGAGFFANGITVTTSRQTVTAYTLALTDIGKLVETNAATANTVIVPLNSSVAIPVGSQIDVVQYGAGQTTIIPESTVTIRSANGWTKINAQYGVVTLIKIATDEWYLFGNLNA